MNIQNKKPLLFGFKEECCGCMACATVCTKHAIRMCADKEGFLYPVIDENLCVMCHACMSVCPFKE